MNAIQDCKASFITQMETIHIDFSLLNQGVQNLRDRTGAAEDRISSIEDALHPLSATVRRATDEMVSLKVKQDDLENRSCQNNLRFVGFPECSEQFLHTWLRDTFGIEALKSPFVIKQAHHTPPRPLPSRGPSRLPDCTDP